MELELGINIKVKEASVYFTKYVEYYKNFIKSLFSKVFVVILLPIY